LVKIRRPTFALKGSTDAAEAVIAPEIPTRLRDVAGMYFAARVFTWLVAWMARDIPTADGGMLGQGVRQSVLAFVSNWDGSWYQRIADVGYQKAHPDGDAFAFFPLYPFSGALLSRLTLGLVSIRIALLAINLAAGLGAAVCLRAWLREETGDDQLANRGVFYLAIFPGAFVLAMTYTEGTFLLLSIASMWAARRNAFGWSGLFAALAVLCRLQGVLLLAPLAVEVFRRSRSDGRWLSAERVAGLTMPCVVLGAWLLYVRSQTGDFFWPITVQTRQGWKGSFLPFWVPLSRDLRHYASIGRGSAIAAMIAVAFVGIAVIAFWKLPASIALYGLLYVTVSNSSANLALGTLRYMLAAVPVFWVLAVFGRRQLVHQAITMLSLMLLGVLTALVATSRFIA
jgi:mannosyltransferase PIG-V